MCAILDNIYREHFNEPGFDRVAQLNFPFHERVFETDVETGEESGSGRVNLETAEDQRLAAEEYVASIAESGAPKPNWWKEFLQSVRMWIADRFPHARQVRMTDREIETLLARSARAAREPAAATAKSSRRKRRDSLPHFGGRAHQTRPEKEISFGTAMSRIPPVLWKPTDSREKGFMQTMNFCTDGIRNISRRRKKPEPWWSLFSMIRNRQGMYWEILPLCDKTA